MKIANINDMVNGWFIGDFTPSVLRTRDFEIAHHFYKAEFQGEPHIHKQAIEINYIVKGMVKVGGEILSNGQMFIFYPYQYEKVVYLADTDLMVIKTPSIPRDKYSIEA
jgi:hypothetical protein